MERTEGPIEGFKQKPKQMCLFPWRNSSDILTFIPNIAILPKPTTAWTYFLIVVCFFRFVLGSGSISNGSAPKFHLNSSPPDLQISILSPKSSKNDDFVISLLAFTCFRANLNFLWPFWVVGPIQKDPRRNSVRLGVLDSPQSFSKPQSWKKRYS